METLAQATNRLTAAGYDGQFLVRGDRVECRVCNQAFSAEELTVDETVRFEGMSDPSDEAVLFAITAPCGHRGTLVATYGPEMPPEEAAIVSHLSGQV